MTMENKIRAFAGSFVLVSLALGWWVHPGFFLFTAFVGANLLQSAFTGLCPLESLLRRLEKAHRPPGAPKPTA
ncbi:MAG: YgaP family membrane protein [Acidobacteriota bacterium]